MYNTDRASSVPMIPSVVFQGTDACDSPDQETPVVYEYKMG